MLNAPRKKKMFFFNQARDPGRMITLTSVSRVGFVGSIVPSGLVRTKSSVHQPLPAASRAHLRAGLSDGTFSKPSAFSTTTYSAGNGTMAFNHNQRGVCVQNEVGRVNSVACSVALGLRVVVASGVSVWLPL